MCHVARRRSICHVITVSIHLTDTFDRPPGSEPPWIFEDQHVRPLFRRTPNGAFCPLIGEAGSRCSRVRQRAMMQRALGFAVSGDTEFCRRCRSAAAVDAFLTGAAKRVSAPTYCRTARSDRLWRTSPTARWACGCFSTIPMSPSIPIISNGASGRCPWAAAIGCSPGPNSAPSASVPSRACWPPARCRA